MSDFIHWDDSDLDLDGLLGEFTDYDQENMFDESWSENDDYDVGVADQSTDSPTVPRKQEAQKPKGRLNTGSGRAIYSCPLCPKTYVTIVGFRGHVKKKHDRPDLKAHSYRQASWDATSDQPVDASEASAPTTGTPTSKSTTEPHSSSKQFSMPTNSQSKMHECLNTIIPKCFKLVVNDPMMDEVRSGSIIGTSIVQVAKDLMEDRDTTNTLCDIFTPKFLHIFAGFGEGNSLTSDREAMWGRFHQARINKDFINSLVTCISEATSEDEKFVRIFIQCLMDRIIREIIKFTAESLMREGNDQAEQITDNDQSVLFYISGYIVHALKKKKTISDCDGESVITTFWTTTESRECYIKKFSEWTKRINRGGLTLPSDTFFLFVRSIELAVRSQVDMSSLNSSSLLCDRLKEHIISNYMVQYYWDILVKCKEELKMKLLEFLVNLFLNIRGGAVAKFMKRQMQKKKKLEKKKSNGKNSQSLRKTLKVKNNLN